MLSIEGDSCWPDLPDFSTAFRAESVVNSTQVITAPDAETLLGPTPTPCPRTCRDCKWQYEQETQDTGKPFVAIEDNHDENQ